MSDQEALQEMASTLAPEESRYGTEHRKTAPARIVAFASGHHLALPLHTTLEIVENPDIFPVPGAAPHALGLLLWQDKWIPVIDLARLLLPQSAPAAEPPKYILVLAFQRVPGQPLEYGALVLPALPETVFVDDSMACELPNDSPLWPAISLSCFSYRDEAIPIVDTGRLLGRSYE